MQHEVRKEDHQTVICRITLQRTACSAKNLYQTIEMESFHQRSIIDISSDEEATPLQQSTPIKYYPLNVVQALNLSEESTTAKMGSESSMDITASTFESGPSPYKRITFSATLDEEREEFSVERPPITNSESSFYEELESSDEMPRLTPAPTLREVTNTFQEDYVPPPKTTKLNDLEEPSENELEDIWGLKPNEDDFYSLAGRGSSFTSKKLQRNIRQPVTVVKEIPHCSGLPAFRARGALSRPAPGRDYSCCSGVQEFKRGRGHGRPKQS